MIDSKAYIHPTANIADDVSIGPWSYIDAGVSIDSGTVVEPHVVIKKNTRIGKHNHIYQFASLGEAPQHTDYKNEDTCVVIGDHNIIREYASINRATAEQDGITAVGHHNFIMSYAHIAHDCKVGNHIVFANNASIAGHVRVDDHVILGGFTGIHQFCHIGAYSFLGRATKIVQDIIPYTIVAGNPGAPTSINSIGLRRNKFSNQEIKAIKDAFSYIYRQGHSQQDALDYLQARVSDFPVLKPLIEVMLNSKRGVARSNEIVNV